MNKIRVIYSLHSKFQNKFEGLTTEHITIHNLCQNVVPNSLKIVFSVYVCYVYITNYILISNILMTMLIFRIMNVLVCHAIHGYIVSETLTMNSFIQI